MWTTYRRIKAAFEALAVATSHFFKIDSQGDDTDDFLETMIVTESLLECGGFSVRPLVSAFRRGRRTEIGGKTVWTGNRDAATQMAKLRASGDPYYVSRDGITDGAAMRMLGVACFYPQEDEMIYAANAISILTHGHPFCHLSAILVALRMRQLLICQEGNVEEQSFDWLEKSFMRALELLGYSQASPMRTLLGQIRALHYETDGGITLEQIEKHIGFLHAATSTPLAAVAASFLSGPLDLPPTPHEIVGASNLVSDDIIDKHRSLFRSNRVVLQDEARAFAPRHDADTFYAILYPMWGLKAPGLLAQHKHNVFERFDKVAEKLEKRWKLQP